MPVAASGASGAATATVSAASAGCSRFSEGVSAIRHSLLAATVRAPVRMTYRPDSTANFPQAAECRASLVLTPIVGRQRKQGLQRIRLAVRISIQFAQG